MMTRDEVGLALDSECGGSLDPRWRFGYTNDLFAYRSESAWSLILVLSLTAGDRRPPRLHGG